MRKNRNAGANTWTDQDDAPELTDERFERADIFDGSHLVRRGRPVSHDPKRQISLRVDADVLEKYRATGPGWQSRMNAALRKSIGLT